MVADSEIQILIKAIDEVSGTTKRIEENISKMADETAKQTKTMGQAFKESTGSLLVLGQAASSVDRIMDSYQNLQLRLENASIRVEEAQKNQRDAQYNLKKVMEDAKSTTDDIAKAQDDLDTATNRVTVAMNNQSRVGNAVIGTYIGIGMQVVTLVASIPALITAVSTLGISLWSLVPALTTVTVVGLPLWAVVLAIAGAVAGIIALIVYWDEVSWALGVAWNWLSENILKPIWKVLVEMFKWVEFALLPLIMLWKFELEVLGGVFNWLWHSILEPIYNWLKDVFLGVLESVMSAIKWVIDNVGKAMSKASGAMSGSYSNVAEKRDVAISSVMKKNDFISRPGQSPVSFSSDDTILGVKDIGNLRGRSIIYEININGNNYGVDGEAIAEALNDMLRRRISI